MPNFEKITEDIYLLKVPFSIVWTGVVLIRGDKNFLIDSGVESAEKYIVPALDRLGMKLSDIDYLLNTHCHGDHISCHHEIVSNYGIKVAAYEKTAETLEDPAENAVRIRTKFPEHSPKPQSWLKGVETDVVLKDGEVLEGRLKVIHTPGHDSDCVCWYDIPSKTLISGDSIQANGTPTQGIGFYQSLDDYMYSLEKLKGEDIENIICGHEYDGIGYFIKGKKNVADCLERCIGFVNEYDRRIREYVNEGYTDDCKIAVRLINEIGCGMPENLFLALYTVNEHLKKIKEGIK